MAHKALLIAALVLLAGCGDTPAGQALRHMAPALGMAEAPMPPVEGPALVLLSPRRVVLVPAGGAGPRRLWRGEGNIAIATEGGRVVATAGLGPVLVASRAEGPDPLDDARALVGRQAAARRTVDLAGADRDPSGMRFGVVLDCVLAGREEGEFAVVEERCVGDRIGFTNRFWVRRDTGAVAQAEQWAGDGLGLLQMRFQGP